MQAAQSDGRQHKLGLFLLSLLASLGIWLVVRNITSTQRAYSIPVEQRNLPDDYVITSRFPDRLNIMGTGEKDDLDLVDKKLGNLRAFVDLRNVDPGTNPNKVRVYLDLPGVPAAVRWSWTPYIDVDVSPTVREPRVVEVEPVGTPEEGYTLASFNVSPSTVELSGLRQDVRKVQRVVAILDLSEVKRGETKAVPLRLLDENGTEVTEGVMTSTGSVTLRATYVPAPAKRYLPIVPTWKGQLPTGYRFAQNHALTPSQLQVTGESQALSKLTSLETEAIDLTNLKQTRTFRVKVKVPKGIRLLGSATVNVTIFIASVPVSPTNPPATTSGTTGTSP